MLIIPICVYLLSSVSPNFKELRTSLAMREGPIINNDQTPKIGRYSDQRILAKLQRNEMLPESIEYAERILNVNFCFL